MTLSALVAQMSMGPQGHPISSYAPKDPFTNEKPVYLQKSPF